MRPFAAAILTLVVSCCAVGQTYTIQTFAGGGLPVNIPGTSASLDYPSSVAVDGAGMERLNGCLDRSGNRDARL
jgi:hypothetical protein